MDMNLKITTSPQGEISQQSVNVDTLLQGSANSTINFKAQVSEKEKELCKKLGITVNQLAELCNKIPGFETLSELEQLNIINKELASSKQVETVEPKQGENAQDEKAHLYELEQANTQDGSFNHKEFSKLSNEEQLKIYTVELAKNKFLYGPDGIQRSVEDWNALTPEQQQALIDTERENLNKSNIIVLRGDDAEAISRALGVKMTELQTANLLNMSSDKLHKAITNKEGYAIDAIHDYVMSLDETDRTDLQNVYIEENAFISRAIVDACIKNGIGEYATDASIEYNLSGTEIAARLKELGKNIEQVEMEYLQSKQNLTREETKRLDDLQLSARRNMLMDKVAQLRVENPEKKVETKILDSMQETKFGELFVAAQGSREKAAILNSYINDSTKDMSAEEKVKFKIGLINELCNEPENSKIRKFVTAHIFKTASKEEQLIIAQMTEQISMSLAADNVTSFGDNEEALLAMQATQANLEKTDEKSAEMFQLQTINNATEDQSVLLSKGYAQAASLNVQTANAEKICTYKNAKNQVIATDNVKAYSDETVVAMAASNVHRYHKDCQVECLETLTKGSKLATEAANRSGVVTKMAKENQVDAFKLMKANIEFLYDDNKEAIEQLNVLSDQISASHVDNQLEMHNEIMQTKYAEVQAHAASNIKDYAPSVQSKAIDKVYESNNKEAVAEVIKNLDKMPPEVQKVEIVRAVAEFLLNAEIASGNLDTKIISGTLTAKELSQLSSQERREYFVKRFECAPPAQKLSMMKSFVGSNMIGATYKKLIFTMIARSSFLKDIVESGMGKTMLKAGLPIDCVNKIVNAMKVSTSNTVIEQRKELATDPAFKTYFKDFVEVDKKIPHENEQKYATPVLLADTNFMKNALSPLSDPAIRKKLMEKDNYTTMFIYG